SSAGNWLLLQGGDVPAELNLSDDPVRAGTSRGDTSQTGLVSRSISADILTAFDRIEPPGTQAQFRRIGAHQLFLVCRWISLERRHRKPGAESDFRTSRAQVVASADGTRFPLARQRYVSPLVRPLVLVRGLNSPARSCSTDARASRKLGRVSGH